MKIKDILHLLEFEVVRVYREDTSEIILECMIGKNGYSNNKKLLQYQDHKLFGIDADFEDKCIILLITNEVEIYS